MITVEKYNRLTSWLIPSKGLSTTQEPNQVKQRNKNMKKKAKALFKGLNFKVLKFFLKLTWTTKIKMAITKASTPPSLLGILRRMA